MLQLGKPTAAAVDANLEHIPPMIQTEDHFTSLTHAVGALLTVYGRSADLDYVAGVTGDCFAIQMPLDRRAMGLVGTHDLLPAALGDLGFSVKFVADELPTDATMRVFTIVRAGLRSFRPCLVCGGWPGGGPGDRDGFWGMIPSFDAARAEFIGCTMRDDLIDRVLSEDLAWPYEGANVQAVYLVENWRASELRPGKRARRALERGVGLLAGEHGFGGLVEYARIIQWLSTARSAREGADPRVYPYPAMVTMRCQFEAIARFLKQIAGAVPRRKRAAHRQASDIATSAAELLLNGEPERAHPRTGRGAVDVGKAIWSEGAWEQLAQELDDPAGSARESEVAKIEQLRDLHGDLIEALDVLASK